MAFGAQKKSLVGIGLIRRTECVLERCGLFIILRSSSLYQKNERKRESMTERIG